MIHARLQRAAKEKRTDLVRKADDLISAPRASTSAGRCLARETSLRRR